MRLDPAFRTFTVRWSHDINNDLRAWGRNGQIQIGGIEIFTLEPRTTKGYVKLSPITSRGEVSGSAYLELPFNHSVLRQVADALAVLASQALAFEVEARHKERP